MTDSKTSTITSESFSSLRESLQLQLTEDSLANYTVWKKGGALGYRCRLEGGGAAQQRDDPRPPPQELPGLAAQRSIFFDRFLLDNIRHQEQLGVEQKIPEQNHDCQEEREFLELSQGGFQYSGISSVNKCD